MKNYCAMYDLHGRYLCCAPSSLDQLIDEAYTTPYAQDVFFIELSLEEYARISTLWKQQLIRTLNT